MNHQQNIQNIYPLTPMQEGMLFHHLSDKDSQAYCVQTAVKISGEFHLDIAEQSLNILVGRHDLLRTVFIHSKKLSRPRQIVFKKRDMTINMHDYSHFKQADHDQYIEEFLRSDFKKGFDLAAGPLFRVEALKLGQSEYVLVFSNHHIILDGWCSKAVLDEFFDIYSDLFHDRPVHNKKSFSFSEYIHWIENQNKDEAHTYWKEYLKGLETNTEVPSFYKKAKNEGFQKEDFYQEIDDDLFQGLENVSKRYKVTVHTICQTAWALLLSHYNQSNDVVFGSVVSGRTPELEGIEEAVGLFINTIPVRIKVDPNLSFRQLFENVQQSNIRSEHYSYCSLADLQNMTTLKGDLLNHFLVFQNYPSHETPEEAEKELFGFHIQELHDTEETNYDFLLTIAPREQFIIIHYNQNIYENDEIGVLCRRFLSILRQMIQTPDMRLSQAELIDADEKSLIDTFQMSDCNMCKDSLTLHERFEQQVDLFPHKAAVTFNGETLTYETLNSRANELAKQLRSLGVQPNHLVGIMLERSHSFMIGILGILKAGAAYVPIDPHYPIERIDYIIQDSKIPILITDRKQKDELFSAIQYRGETLFIDDTQTGGFSENLPSVSSAQDLAYVIYTSGSTGKPKGILTKHENVMRVVVNSNYLKVTEEDRILQLSNLSFDGSVFDIFAALLNGAELILPQSNTVLSPRELSRFLIKQDISIMFLTTALFNAVIAENPTAFNGLRKVLFGGEKVTVAFVEQALEQAGANKFIHVYGPTESTVFASFYPIQSIDKRLGTIPIGTPLNDTELIILNQYGKIQAIGLPGELCIAGKGLAKGYLNRPDLSEEKFVTHPLKEQERLYKTGDLARWLPDGSIEFMGRLDRQVKIRGFRIEPEEVAAELLLLSNIKKAYVMERRSEQGEAYLCAYYVADANKPSKDIRRELAERLPEYMLPSFFMSLNELPVTPNGKISEKELPAPECMLDGEREYIAPRTAAEKRLVKLWEQILSVKPVGVNTHFFEAGGHSLKAVSLMGAIEREFSVKLSIKQIFDHPYLEDMAMVIDQAETEASLGMLPAPPQDYYPASANQRRIYAVSHLHGREQSYNMPVLLKVPHPLNIDRVQKSINMLVERHESLRTSFEMVEGELVQNIHSSVNVEVITTKVGKDGLYKQVSAWIKPFDLQRAPLLRAGILEDHEEHFLFLDMHHIISDGHSIHIFLQELIQLYEHSQPLPPLALQYKDYAVWEKQRETDVDVSYWKKQFEDEIPVLALPVDEQKGTGTELEGSFHIKTLDMDLTDQVKKYVLQTNQTLFSFLLGIYQLLLAKYTGQKDIVVGTPVSGRHDSLESTVGMFVKTLPIRVQLNPQWTIGEFFSTVREHCLAAFESEVDPAEWIMNRSRIKMDLIQTMFSFNHDQAELPAQWEIQNIFNPHVQFDLSLDVFEHHSNLDIYFEYSTNLFKKETIERMAKHFEHLIEAVLADPEQSLGELELMSKDEQTLLAKMNDTDVPLPSCRSISAQFETQAKIRPEETAAVFRGDRLSYRELNSRANQLAHLLLKKGVGPDVLVGIMVRPSFDLLVGMLGVLKAGGAYVPIDPEYPESRIQYMLKDSQVSLLLTQSKLTEKTGSFSGQVIDVDKGFKGESDLNPPSIAEGHHLAYMIYTSGSTGEPKGVLIEQHSVLNLWQWFERTYDVSSGDAILHMTNPSFDVSVEETLIPLMSGAVVVIAEKQVMFQPEKLINFLNEYHVRIAQFVPATLRALLAGQTKKAASLDLVICGGEKLELQLARQITAQGYKLYNNYGPTETTVDALVWPCPPNSEVIKLGAPIDRTRVYVLDQDGKQVPPGIPGELYIGGAGVARGYYNRPDQTKRAFVSHPNGRLYRTGDLVKWHSDQTITYLGRLDKQVKIRGVRIEPGEITAKLLELNEVKNGYVMAHHDEAGQAILCAYLVTETEIEPETIRKQLAKSLPDYMIPVYFITVDELPLTPNGKINEQLLPMPKKEMKETYEPPQTETEKILAAIWEEVLETSPIGLNSHFIRTGGHSLKAIDLMSRIRNRLSTKISLQDIFEYPLLKELAEKIDKTGKSEKDIIPAVGNTKMHRMTSLQKRIYAACHLLGVDKTYNMPIVLKVPFQLDKQKTERVIKRIIERHESLRTSFQVINGETVQVIHDHINFQIEEEWLKANEVSARISVWPKRFDLEKAPLLRAKIAKVDNGDHLLFLDIHHIICDGISIDIFLHEFSSLYEDQQAELPPVQVQYKDYAAWKQKQDHSKSTEHWDSVLDGQLPVLDIPTDFSRPKLQQFEGDCVSLSIDREMGCSILEKLHDEEMTPYVLFLGLYHVLLHRYSSQDDVVSGTAVSGRDHKELENTIGLFMNILPIRTKTAATMTITSFLEQVKKQVYDMLKYADYPLDEWIERKRMKRIIDRNLLFDTVFSFHTEEKVSKWTLKKTDQKTAKFDLTFEVIQSHDVFHINVEYSTSLFHAKTIERIAKHYIELVRQYVTKPDQLLNEIDFRLAEEKRLIEQVNSTTVPLPAHETVCTKMRLSAEQHPDAIAAVYQGKSLTYKELKEKADGVADWLIQQGINKGEIVGIMTNPSFNMLIGIFGILQAGAAYVPIDPAYPRKRIEYILQDSEVNFLLTESEHQSMLKGIPQKIVELDTHHFERNGMSSFVSIQGHDLAYLIYTSGSTGNPKGVMIEHRSLMNLVQWHQRSFHLTEKDRCLKFAGVGFDASVWEIFPCLSSGASLYIVDTYMRQDMYQLNQFIEDQKVTIAFIPTAYYEPFSHLKNNSLRILLTGGEALKTWKPHSYKLVNNYGPTENTVIATSGVIENDTHITIGTPIDNCRVLIVNEQFQEQPIGITGEICLAGVGLARGYWNRSEEMKERFVQHPVTKERLYRTGDHGRWTADGTIEYIGREDEQINIRGHRVEMQEIIQVMKLTPGIMDVYLLPKALNTSAARLIAYIICDQSNSMDDIKKQLAERLPDYMVPSQFIELDHFPLTENGKVDKKALPKPLQAKSHTEQHVEPRTKREKKMREIWGEVLNIPPASIGIYDHFFELGGNSINILKILALTMDQDWDISIQDFFDKKTIAEICKQTKRQENQTDEHVYIRPACCSLSGDIKWHNKSNVFLTGATGFLGIHLLEQLLRTTNGDIFCLVRGNQTYTAEERLKQVFSQYFPNKMDLLEQTADRLIVIDGDLTKERFGMNPNIYENVRNRTEHIFHVAAKTDHFGEFDEFKAFNIDGTKRILAFAGADKKLHYISTMSVAGHLAKGEGERTFTEEEFFIEQEIDDNVYVKSKFLAEHEVLKAIARKEAQATIYRMGLITGRLADGCVQLDLEKNAFSNTLETIYHLGAVSDEIVQQPLDISPVDLCSEAILTLAASSESKPVFHIYNPHKIHIKKLFDLGGIEIKQLSDHDYQELVASHANEENYHKILGFTYYMGEENETYRALVETSCDETVQLLTQSGFQWPEPSAGYMKKLFSMMRKKGYFLKEHVESI
ncbi:amino acid adenylation domain-containing protein [Bacillus sp. WMMC1349]|uniref:non-ribosomal peptide synthetase n=1 Tax=Bacillus sp. WMMC1349 TaxID=2736254 RepID=UPI001555D850|nr:non-ribosomal peptide synthetase [Bacillus sp. WMMC1349]NPC91659.1 amino acid adenylation domain-containing protein [Bacillus sp. WMMC1349]